LALKHEKIQVKNEREQPGEVAEHPDEQKPDDAEPERKNQGEQGNPDDSWEEPFGITSSSLFVFLLLSPLNEVNGQAQVDGG
jgi:hypothetical protein